MKRALLGALLLALLGGAFGAGWYFGQESGKRDGFEVGVRYGEVQASKKKPIPVRDRGHSPTELAADPRFGTLPLLGDEPAALAALANRAASPCSSGAERGTSLASALLDDGLDCPALGPQLRLGLAALRTFGGGDGATAEARDEAIEEAVAVLRVERRTTLPAAPRRTPRGSADAPVTLTLFTDFQCPYCARAEPLVAEILEEHGDRIALDVRHLPLTRIHPAAWPAALAAEAASEQDRFWDMYDALFVLGPSGLGEALGMSRPGWFGRLIGRSASAGELARWWSEGTWREAQGEDGAVDEVVLDLPEGAVPFEGQAKDLGLDVEAFRAAMRDPAIWRRVAEDLQLAREVGATGTPSFFVNGRKVTERRSPDVFGKLIDKAEAEADWRFSWGLEPPPSGVEAP